MAGVVSRALLTLQAPSSTAAMRLAVSREAPRHMQIFDAKRNSWGCRTCSSTPAGGRGGQGEGGAEWEVIGAKKPQGGASWTVGDEQSTSKKCDPYEQGGKPLGPEESERLRSGQVPEWIMADDHRSISRTWRSESFQEAADFVQRISVLSMNEGHQPRSVKMELVRGKEELVVILSTPRLKGLSYADVRGKLWAAMQCLRP